MESLDKYYVLFNREKDRFTLTLYDELMNTFWRTKEIFIIEEINNWRNIDFESRRIILGGLFVSHTFKQAVSLEFIPSMIFSLSDEDVAKKAILAAIASRLSGQHAAITSEIIEDLNESSLKQEIFKEVKRNESVLKILSYVEGIFNGMVGWNQIVRHGQQVAGKSDPFVELNKHIWQSAALATLLIETADSMFVPLLFKSMEGNRMDEILKSAQAMTRDKAIMSSFFSKLALSKFENLPKKVQEEQEEWLRNAVAHIYQIEWSKTHEKVEYKVLADKGASVAFMEYNVNKALAKLNMKPFYERTEMPYIVEKYLKINLDLEELDIRKRKEPWFSWRNR